MSASARSQLLFPARFTAPYSVAMKKTSLRGVVTISPSNFGRMREWRAPSLSVKLELMQKPICFALVFAALPFGLAGLCVAKAASTVFMAATNFAAARRILR